MLCILCFIGALVFLAMRMRIFFKKKELPENLETSEDLNGPVSMGSKRLSKHTKPKLRIITNGQIKKGSKASTSARRIQKRMTGKMQTHNLGTLGTLGTFTELQEIPKTKQAKNKKATTLNELPERMKDSMPKTNHDIGF